MPLPGTWAAFVPPKPSPSLNDMWSAWVASNLPSPPPPPRPPVWTDVPQKPPPSLMPVPGWTQTAPAAPEWVPAASGMPGQAPAAGMPAPFPGASYRPLYGNQFGASLSQLLASAMKLAGAAPDSQSRLVGAKTMYDALKLQHQHERERERALGSSPALNVLRRG